MKGTGTEHTRSFLSGRSTKRTSGECSRPTRRGEQCQAESHHMCCLTPPPFPLLGSSPASLPRNCLSHQTVRPSGEGTLCQMPVSPTVWCIVGAQKISVEGREEKRKAEQGERKGADTAELQKTEWIRAWAQAPGTPFLAHWKQTHAAPRAHPPQAQAPTPLPLAAAQPL